MLVKYGAEYTIYGIAGIIALTPAQGKRLYCFCKGVKMKIFHYTNDVAMVGSPSLFIRLANGFGSRLVPECFCHRLVNQHCLRFIGAVLF